MVITPHLPVLQASLAHKHHLISIEASRLSNASLPGGATSAAMP